MFGRDDDPETEKSNSTLAGPGYGSGQRKIANLPHFAKTCSVHVSNFAIWRYKSSTCDIAFWQTRRLESAVGST